MTTSPQNEVKDVIEGTIATHFADLVDGRDNQGKRHLLMDVITIAIAASSLGGEGWTDAWRLFGQTKETWFRSFLTLTWNSIR
ncbi:MAG: transposase family protein [Chloroflexota bacterium]